MEQFVCTIEACRRKLTLLNEEHFARLIGLDESVRKIYEKADGDYENIIEYMVQELSGTTKKFREAIDIIIGLGDNNYLPILRQNLSGSAYVAPVDLAAELYFARRGAAKQLFQLLSADSGTIFYCRNSGGNWQPPESRLAEYSAALNLHLKRHRQSELTGISSFQTDNAWRILLHRTEMFLDDNTRQEMTGCIVVDFCPISGEIRLAGNGCAWQFFSFATLFGVIFFNDWNFFDRHKIYSLSAIVNSGLTVQPVKYPIKKIIAQSVSLISNLGIVSNFPVKDCNNYIGLMFGRISAAYLGNEIYSITLQIVFPGKIRTVKVCHDRLDGDLTCEEIMLLEECLFAGNVLVINPDHAPRGKSFWHQMPFIVSQKHLCLDNWRRVLDGCVDFETFITQFLTVGNGFDHIAACPNLLCGKNCMTDVFFDGKEFLTICTNNPECTCHIESEAVVLHTFRQDQFNRMLSGKMNLSSGIKQLGKVTWELGVMCRGKKHQCRIILSFESPEGLTPILLQSCLNSKIPVMILSTSKGNFTEDILLSMEKHHVRHLEVSDFIGVDFNCRFSVSDDFREKCFPEADIEVKYPAGIVLPPDTQWEDITLKFKDLHTLVCITGDQSTVLGFWDCGMADRRTGQPNGNWLLLAALAEMQGIWKLEWQNHKKSLREQQRKKRLSAELKKLFNIPGDPIVFDSDNISYRCRFKLRN